jgi:hypothetical protein
LNRSPLIFNNLTKDGYGCYLKFTFNTFGIIDSITYLGKLNVSYNSLISLVGLHESYLNELFARYELNMVEDIPEFLSENWAVAIYHDNFSKLVIKMKTIIQDDDIESIINNILNNNLTLSRDNLKLILKGVSDSTLKKIELELISFLQENKNHLPFYYLP